MISKLVSEGEKFIVKMKTIKVPVRITTPFLPPTVNDNATGP